MLPKQLFLHAHSHTEIDLLLTWRKQKNRGESLYQFFLCCKSHQLEVCGLEALPFLASPSLSHTNCCWKKKGYCLNDRAGYTTAYRNTGLDSTSVPQMRGGLVHIEDRLSSSLKLSQGVYLSFPNLIKQKNKEPRPYHKLSNQAYENSSLETYGFSVIQKLQLNGTVKTIHCFTMYW